MEGTETFQSVKGGLEGVLIGEVLTCHKHPDADKLSVTTVDVGADEPVQIVCGAPNVAAGQKVPVATVGTTLYSGQEEFIIKKAKIRGELSFGMICAEDELGLGNSHEGIMVLDGSALTGTPASDNSFLVPPVLKTSKPNRLNPWANSVTPLLFETLMIARINPP